VSTLTDFLPQLSPYRQLRIFFPREGDGQEHDLMPQDPLDERLVFELDVVQEEGGVNAILVYPGDLIEGVVAFVWGLRELALFLEKLQVFCAAHGQKLELHSPF